MAAGGAPGGDARPGGGRPDVAAALAVAGVGAAALLSYAPTVAAMAAIWARSGTFAHGFIVLPACLWLLWRGRARVAAARPRVTWAALAPLAGLVAAWVMAELVGAGVVAQFAAVLMAPAAVLLLLGADVLRAAAFPLCFALLAVPFGEFLMPGLMDVTARGSVLLLQLTGVPVFRDGWLISIPEGNFHVAEACSGVRYLIAAVTIAVLFGQFFYSSTSKRIKFIGFTIVLTVLANVLRAYIIILLARLTDMRLAVGVDHFIYGWVLFSVLLAALFAVGLRYADPLPAPAAPSPVPWRLPAPAALVPAAVVGLGVLLAGPAVLDRLAGDGSRPDTGLPAAPVRLGGATLAGAAPFPAWLEPRAGDNGAVVAYRGGPLGFDLLIIGAGTGPGAREVGTLRPYLAGEGVTLVADDAAVTAGGRAYRQMRLDTGGRVMLVAYWFAVGDRQTANPITAKVMELLTILQGEHTRPALLAVALETTTLDQSAQALQEIVAQAVDSPCLARRALPAPPEPDDRCREVTPGAEQQG